MPIHQDETIEVLRGIRDLLVKIDQKLDDHGQRLIDVEKRNREIGMYFYSVETLMCQLYSDHGK